MKNKPICIENAIYAEWDGENIKLFNADNYIELTSNGVEAFEKFRMDILKYLVQTTGGKNEIL